MGGVSGGERVCSSLQWRRPPRCSVSPLASGDLRERGDSWRRRRGGGSAVAEPHWAAQHTLQRPGPRRWTLVQVAVVAARAGAAFRGGSDETPVNRWRGDVDVHLALDHGRSSFSPTDCLLVFLLFVLFFIINIIIISLN